MARLAIRTLLLVCAALPAAGATPLATPGDAIEAVDFYARARVVLPSGAIQVAEVRGGTVLPGAIVLHLRMKRRSGTAQNAEWRMYRVPQTPNPFDTGVLAAPIQANGDVSAFTPTHVQDGAYQFRAIADPQNRFRETPRARTNNERFIVLVVAQPPSNQPTEEPPQ